MNFIHNLWPPVLARTTNWMYEWRPCVCCWSSSLGVGPCLAIAQHKSIRRMLTGYGVGEYLRGKSISWPKPDSSHPARHRVLGKRIASHQHTHTSIHSQQQRLRLKKRRNTHIFNRNLDSDLKYKKLLHFENKFFNQKQNKLELDPFITIIDQT